MGWGGGWRGEGWGANRKQKGGEGAGDWEEVRGRERQRGPHGAEKNEGVEGTAETGWMGGWEPFGSPEDRQFRRFEGSPAQMVEPDRIGGRLAVKPADLVRFVKHWNKLFNISVLCYCKTWTKQITLLCTNFHKHICDL